MVELITAALPIFHRSWLYSAKKACGKFGLGREAEISGTANPDSFSAAVRSAANFFNAEGVLDLYYGRITTEPATMRVTDAI